MEEKVGWFSSVSFLIVTVFNRWYLMHWLVFHLLALVVLFITSILVFVVQVSLWKMIGIIPVVVAIFTIYCWAKVTLVMVIYYTTFL